MGVELELESSAEAAAQARRALDRQVVGTLPERRMRDLRLLVSELVTNAVRHAGLAPGERIRLRIDIRARALRVEVQDSGRGFVPRPPRADPARASGWGLFLVEELADRWGLDGTAPGTSIWFELDRDGMSGAQPVD